jgi:RimJ/RimL family protein N-acetyltransferase
LDGDSNGRGAAGALEQPGILLRGRSIVLRRYREDELDGVVDARRRSQHSVGEPDRDWIRRRIENSGGWFEGQLDVAIEGAGQLVGTLDARAPLRAMPPGVCEIGIEIFEQERGKGLGTEAVRLFSEWLLANGYPRVQASTDLRNAPMRRIFEKLGWEFEGVLRAFMPDGADRADYGLYSLTRVA